MYTESFDAWWKINGRPEWDSTMARAAWDSASKVIEQKFASTNSAMVPCADVAKIMLRKDINEFGKLAAIGELIARHQ